MLFLNDLTRFKLDAIPTVGLSGPILSYLSAIQFIFDDIRMLKDGYEKVVYLSLYVLLYLTDDSAALDKAGFIQNRHFSKMDGAGCRACANRRCQEGPRRSSV